MSESKTCLVVPCFNEEMRLDDVKYEMLIDSGLVTLLFVDDCSTDQTKKRVQGFASKWPNCVAVISQVKNQGKGEAVRVGLLGAIRMGNQRVGFMDADFAVPPKEVLRFINESNKMDEKLVWEVKFRERLSAIYLGEYLRQLHLLLPKFMFMILSVGLKPLWLIQI